MRDSWPRSSARNLRPRKHHTVSARFTTRVGVAAIDPVIKSEQEAHNAILIRRSLVQLQW